MTSRCPLFISKTNIVSKWMVFSTNFRLPSPVCIILRALVVPVRQTVSTIRQHVDGITEDPMTRANATALHYQLSTFYLYVLSMTINYPGRANIIRIFRVISDIFDSSCDTNHHLVCLPTLPASFSTFILLTILQNYT